MATDILSADVSTSPCEAARLAAARGELVSPIGAGQGSGAMDAAGAFSGTSAYRRDSSAIVSDYVQLTKPRIVVMIMVTTMATAMLGAGGFVSAWDLCWLLLGTAAVAASAGAANQILERVIDGRMTRTAGRPLPAGRLGVGPASVFAALLGLGGSAVLYLMFGPIPAAVGIATWLLYVLVYTPMKTRTAWNTTVGAVAGALPVLIGYTAMGGFLTQWTSWLLVGVLVAWQYPHFMAIAWLYRRQYAAAGFCMTTTVDPTGRSASVQSVLGSLVLIVCGVVLCWIPAGWIAATLAATAVVASGMPMMLASIRFARQPGDALARKLLRSSLLVLPAVLAIVTLRLFW